jgi:hypothetical protein
MCMEYYSSIQNVNVNTELQNTDFNFHFNAFSINKPNFWISQKLSQESFTVFTVCEQDSKLIKMPGLKFHLTNSGIKLYKPLELEYSNVTASTILHVMIR